MNISFFWHPVYHIHYGNSYTYIISKKTLFLIIIYIILEGDNLRKYEIRKLIIIKGGS